MCAGDLPPQTGHMTSPRNPKRDFFHQAPASVWLLAMAVLLLTSRPLFAGARDDVIAGMFRCAAIGDTRVWLDCYYGAAQPLRVQLGIVPAPQNQVRLAQNPPAGTPAGDLAPRYQTTSSALRCNDLPQDRSWLNCYYAAAGPVRAQLGLSPAPQPAAPTQAATGMLASAQPNPSREASLPRAGASGLAPGWSRMASYHFNRFGIFTLELANGQQWQQ